MSKIPILEHASRICPSEDIGDVCPVFRKRFSAQPGTQAKLEITVECTIDYRTAAQLSVNNDTLSAFSGAVCWSLRQADGTVSEGSALFAPPKHFAFEDPHLRCEISGDTITVYADRYARSVEIDSTDSDFILSDNYFDMNPGSKAVRILSGTPKTLRLRSVFDLR